MNAVLGFSTLLLLTQQTEEQRQMVTSIRSCGENLLEILDNILDICRIEDGKVRLLTRNGHDWTKKYGELSQDCAELECKNALLDGEIVCLDETGKSSFHALQEALKTGATEKLVFYVFDLIYLNGRDLSENECGCRTQP